MVRAIRRVLTSIPWIILGAGLGIGFTALVNAVNVAGRVDRIGPDGLADCTISRSEGEITWGALGLAVLLVFLSGVIIAASNSPVKGIYSVSDGARGKVLDIVGLTVTAGLVAGILETVLARWGMRVSAREYPVDAVCMTPDDLLFVSRMAAVYVGLLLAVLVGALVAKIAGRAHS